MKLVVGLGNPGVRYRRTRHNVGFMVIDALADRWRITVSGARHEAELGTGEIRGERVVLAKPRTFMNLSGEAVAKLRRLYHLEPAEILAVYDDLDLPLGKVRLRSAGGAGGHNGVVSLISVLGKGFPRLRIGIGRPPGGADPVGFVLEAFAANESAVIADAIARAADAVESWIAEGLEATMNRVNRGGETRG
ncbi:MAG: aminoacyl-tRNA hydrolase [Dehalococcoidia bacterium]|nr:aminoacyl-tRNA hydrolase [Dehalococcoidia bacterium]